MRVIYVAEPPQFARLGIMRGNSTTAYDWQVGDRVRWGATPTYPTEEYVYVCTTAGSGTWPFTQPATTAPATITLGTSVWTRYSPSSWAYATPAFTLNGASMDTWQQVIYVDYRWPDAATADSARPVMSVVVNVDPDTMRPTPGRGPATFLSGAPDGYHARRNVFNRLLGAVSPGVMAKNYTSTDIECEAPSSSKVSGFGVTQYTLDLLPTKDVNGYGYGVTVIPKDTQVSATAVPQAGHTGVYFHKECSPSSAAPTIQNLVGYPAATYSTLLSQECSATGVTATARLTGQGVALAVDTGVYKEGATPVGDTDMSLRLSISDYVASGTLGRTDHLIVQNTLTGARTIKVYVATVSPFGTLITNMDLWIEVLYPSDSTSAQYTMASTANANMGCEEAVGTAVPIDAGASWAGLSAYQPTYFAISLPVTIQKANPLYIRVCVFGHKFRQNTYVSPYVEVV